MYVYIYIYTHIYKYTYIVYIYIYIYTCTHILYIYIHRTHKSTNMLPKMQNGTGTHARATREACTPSHSTPPPKKGSDLPNLKISLKKPKKA